MADTLQQRQHLFSKLELEQGIVTRDHLGFATALNQDARPRFGRLAERTWASTRWLSSTRSTRISSLPPDAFWPNSRAGITRYC